MMARWEPSQHERTTALDHSMELQADRTEITPTGPSEVAEPLCAAHLRCAVRCAPPQETAETVSRALAYLTDRLIWPYCLTLMAERCLELHERIESTHGFYQRYAEGSAANPIASDLHDHLAWLLGDSLLDVRDDTPRAMDRDGRRTGEIIPVQEWMAGIGMAHPLAQRCERNGSIVPETVVETVRRNLAELYARPNDEHVVSYSVTRPREPGPTVVANVAAHHQLDADAASARGPSLSGPTMAGFDYDDLEYGSSYYDHVNDDDDVYEDNYEDIWEGETTWEKGSNTTFTTRTSGVKLVTTPPHLITTPPHIFSFGSPALPKAIHVDAGVSATTLNYPVDECADSTADDRAFAEHRADFTANGRADPIADAVTSTPDIIPPQYDVFNDDLLMVELDDADAFFVDVRKSERCDSDAGYDDDGASLLADHVPARAQTVATAGADEVSDEDLDAHTAVLDREDVSSWATNMQMECHLARLNEMAKRELEMNREINRQLEQVYRQLLSARTARVEKPTHAQSPDCDEGISEVHAGPDDLAMVDVDAMTAEESSGSSTDSDHGYDDDDDGKFW